MNRVTATRTTAKPMAAARASTFAFAFAFAFAGLLPAPALAASVSFGTPTATAIYDQSIDFSVKMTSSGPVERVELWLGFPDSIGPFVVSVDDTGGSGPRTLDYTLDLTGSGHLAPNTRLTVTWAAYPEAGADPVTSQVESVSYQDTTEDWQTVQGDIVTVHWYQGDQAFATRALDIGEQAIRNTADLLGVTESDPVDFFIYADDAAFRQALGPGTRENVGGQAHPDIRTLFALITPGEINDPWVGVVIPHELVHLVFDTAVQNPYRFPPRWLNEGLAVYLSEGYTSSDQGLVSDAVASGDLMPLDALSGQFPTEFNLTYLAYAESVSSIDYLVRTYDQDALVALVNAYKDGLTDDQAFTQALGVDLATFQAGWLAALGAQPPQRYGPQPAPTAPPPDIAAPAEPGSQADSTPALIVLVAIVVIAVAGLGLVLARRGRRAA
jgi:Peptidase MA superfamily